MVQLGTSCRQKLHMLHLRAPSAVHASSEWCISLDGCKKTVNVTFFSPFARTISYSVDVLLNLVRPKYIGAINLVVTSAPPTCIALLRVWFLNNVAYE